MLLSIVVREKGMSYLKDADIAICLSILLFI